MSAFMIGLTIAVLLIFTLVLIPFFRMGFAMVKRAQPQSGTTATSNTPTGTTKKALSEKLLTASNFALLGFIVLVAAYVAGTSLDMGQMAKWIALAFGMFLLVRLITPGPWAIFVAAILLIIFGWFGAERSQVVVDGINNIPDIIIGADGKGGTGGSSIDVLCQDQNGGALPRCAVMTLSDIPIDMFAPSGHCLVDNPGGSMNFAASPKGVGWWSLTSKTGKPTQVGIYKPRVGQSFFGAPCV